MQITPPDISHDKTRQRLLEAAGEVFADHGFSKATVRDICARAEANVAAVSYHFGDKEKLYAEVLKYAHGCAIAKYPPSLGLAPDSPPEKRLHAFVLSFLQRLLDEGRPAWHARIISKEMAEPTGAMDSMVDDQIKPHFIYIAQVMRELLGSKTDEQTIRLCCNSVIGQCLFYHFAQPITRRLFPQRIFSMKDVELIAQHITQLTLKGTRAMVKANKNGAK